MEVLPYLVIAAAGLLVAVLVWAGRPRDKQLPYTRRKALLTQAELRFYRVLLTATPKGMAVFVKVRLMDVLAVQDGEWQEHGAPGSGMHLDFVLADAATTETRLVVELDDRSHWAAEAQKRDAFKNAALVAAGVPIVRVTAAARYDAMDLRRRIEGAV